MVYTDSILLTHNVTSSKYPHNRVIIIIRTWYVHFPLMCVGLLPSEDTSYWVFN